MSRLILHQAEQVVTLAGSATARSGAAMSELAVMQHASVICEGSRIAWIGDAHRAMLREGDDVIDCRGRAVVPAFIDAHTHLVWAGDRKDELELRLMGTDYEQIFAGGGGILSSVRATRAADEQQLFDEARRRMQRMRRCGTTTFEIKSGYGLDLETELRQLRVARRLRDEAGFRVRATCLAAHAVPAEYRDDREGYVALVCQRILPAVAAAGLADDCDVFCDRGAFSAEEARTILERARSLGLGIRLHANEFGHTGGAQLAAELRATSADHLLHLDPNERAALRDANVMATLLPGTSLVLGKPFADGRALVNDGIAVVVASDCNPGSCALENLGLVLALACYGNRLTPAEALCAVTHNAAVALRLGHELGRIEPGLRADLLVLACDDYRDLVYHAGSPLVDVVLQDGVRMTELR